MAIFKKTTGKKAASGSVSSAKAVIRRMHVTEKTSAPAGTTNRYAFVVADTANKHEIRASVEGRFSVSVTGVRVINMPEKIRRRGRQIGHKRGFKKAIVTVAAGHSIDSNEKA